jgi:hypothetical protein
LFPGLRNHEKSGNSVFWWDFLCRNGATVLGSGAWRVGAEFLRASNIAEVVRATNVEVVRATNVEVVRVFATCTHETRRD